MMFVRNVGAMLRPKVVRDKKVMGCSCGYTGRFKASSMWLFQRRKKIKSESLKLLKKKLQLHPVIDEECPKCKNPKAFTWSQQMRAGDEPETIFYKCTECAVINGEADK